MRNFQIDLNEYHVYLVTHANRYFDRLESEPERAKDSLERAANYTGIFEYGDPWTEEIEEKTIEILTEIRSKYCV
ncbi:MAG: hypothetical protein LRZ84_14330 [Desertifilum sp.]|nr:hypothetical protein [Desertifilum sp.]